MRAVTLLIVAECSLEGSSMSFIEICEKSRVDFSEIEKALLKCAMSLYSIDPENQNEESTHIFLLMFAWFKQSFL